MRRFLAGLALLCLLVPTLALAQRQRRIMTGAIVVSVDLKAKSMTFRYTISGNTRQTDATWNAKTKWADGTQGETKIKQATADLAKLLKVGDKVRVEVEDENFASVTVLSPSEKIDS